MKFETATQRGSIARYTLLPGILPRLRTLLGGGFDYLAYFIAVVFNTLGIIPDGHLYLRRSSRGHFSVIQVLVVAANNITFDRKNLDKVSVFFVIIAGLVIMLMQFLLFIVMLLTGRAFAYDGPGPGPATMAEFFSNPAPDKDIAFRLLDLVFGMPGIFNLTEAQMTPFHKALHAMFEFYSYGMLLVGTFIIIYLVIRIVLETAQSGAPFGERFTHAWAPVRLILFFGLLLPATNGLNLAQYTVLEAAKLGSNVATNAWLNFDKAVGKSPYLGAPEELIAEPNPPNLSSLISFMQLAKTCSWAEGSVNGRDIKPYAVFADKKAVDLGKSGASLTDLSELAKDEGTIFIRFGVRDEKGAVNPFCGELMLTITDQAQPGSTYVQQSYLDLISCFWTGTGSDGSSPKDSFQNLACKATQKNTANRSKAYTDRYSTGPLTSNPYPNMYTVEDDQAHIDSLTNVSAFMGQAITDGRDKQVKEGDWVNDAAREMGWAGAGIWFNKIAEQNGAFSSAVYAKPEIHLMPGVMEFVRRQKLKENVNTPAEELFVPTLSSGNVVQYEEPQQREVLMILNQLFAYWGSENTTAFIKGLPESQDATMTGNVIIDVMNVFMGTRGLFDMCRNTKVHPLAQLSSLGKGLIEHAIRSFALAAGTGIGGGILAILKQAEFAQTLHAASSFFITFAGIGLILGFLLFYVIPFLPFVYFFFAVMTWIKGIFEAMVGMPLWALAHLHIDGEGMPGDAAASGYFHILEIFLRPVCILIGLLGGISIFAAMVKVMNQIFYVVLSNLAGHHVDAGVGCFAPPGTTTSVVEEQFLSGTIDQFFYTVLYTIIVYIFAIPCFKLVDLVPDNIMRWMGAGISSFGAQDGDDVEGLMTHVSYGAGQVGSNLKGAQASASSFFGF